MTPAERIPTPIDRLAEEWLEQQLALDPALHVELGRPGREGEYADYSPEGHADAAQAAAEMLVRARAEAPVDDVDQVTRAELIRTLELDADLHAAGFWRFDLNVIASPAQGVRDLFDLMPAETSEDWEHIRLRMEHVPGALAGWQQSLRAGIDAELTPAIRQVEAVIEQLRRQGGPEGFFAGLAEQAPEDQREHLRAAARTADAGYQELIAFLGEELAPRARTRDALGRERYAIASRQFIGVEVDLEETYAWGVEELARVVAEQEAVAAQIAPGGGVAEAIAVLEADPSMQLHGTDALQSWMQERSDEAIRELAGTHFDIPEALKRIECRIAPTNEGGIYYTPPSEDFSRPGRMWWSVPEGVERFDTWRELTTVYHEGVPGHHLQLGLAVAPETGLNSWRRMNWNSGHGEGWALYSERLMDALGYLRTPADRLGMLDGQRMRAARVVIDIGVHLGLPKPDGTGAWTGDDVEPFLAQHVNMNAGFVRFESLRYLGWAGQAPSYSVGQREWGRLREAWTQLHGDDPRRFHAEALRHGSIGLGVLRSTLLDG